MEFMNEWFSEYFITRSITVFEWISWTNDSKTNTFLTAPPHPKKMRTQPFQFYNKYAIPGLKCSILELGFSIPNPTDPKL